MNILVVGYGVMGKNHARVLEEMGHAVKTLDPKTISGAQHHSLTQDLVDWPHAVCVATPIEDLSRIAALWLERGKDVLVEKPGAFTVDQLERAQHCGEINGCRLLVGYTERFNPAIQALANHLHRVGTVRHIHIRRLGYASDRGGDPVFDLATHDLDVLDALGFNLHLEHVVRSDHHLAAHLAAQHISPLVIPGTPSVSLEASHLHPNKVRALEVVGDDGVLQLDYQRQTLGLLAPGIIRIALPVDQAEPLQREWEAFFAGDGSSGTAALSIAEEMAATGARAMVAA